MPDMLPCYVFVDGQYVRAEFRKAGMNDLFNPRKPALFVQNERIAARQLAPTRIFYYDALPDRTTPEERTREKAYFDRIRALPDTHVVLGEVRKGEKKKREQKGVDVQLAVDALRAAMRRTAEAIGLVTGDADFVPVAKAIREAGVHVLVLGFPASLSEALANEADRVIRFSAIPTDWNLPDD
jgi:uncharacterized LabA/DUF88 family protein